MNARPTLTDIELPRGEGAAVLFWNPDGQHRIEALSATRWRVADVEHKVTVTVAEVVEQDGAFYLATKRGLTARNTDWRRLVCNCIN
ncbi:hypothetical protein [Marisediminicola sp. LYQ134]|uniref:hypothetical protein n=1 Tax=unclassified Marisediminicola TaxID=2618316 RepID=UPI0039830ED9